LKDSQEMLRSFDFGWTSLFRLLTKKVSNENVSGYVVFNGVGYPSCLNVPNYIIMTVSVLPRDKIQL